MLDIKLMRERPDFVRERLASRGAGDEGRIDEVLKLDEQRRKLLNEVEAMKAQRNRVSKEIGALMAQKKKEEAEAKKTETRELGDRIAQRVDRHPEITRSYPPRRVQTAQCSPKRLHFPFADQDGTVVIRPIA